MTAEKNRDRLDQMLHDYTYGRASSEVVAAVIQARATLVLADAVREVGALLAGTESLQMAVAEGEPLVTEGGAEVRPGDPDPTPLAPEGRWCGAEAPIGPMACTWSYGHEGAHVAGNGTIAVEVWS